MRNAANHVHAAVLRAVAAITGIDPLDREKPAIIPAMIVESITSQDWASLTFVGATHAIALRLEGDAEAIARMTLCLAARLPGHDIPLAGQIVADIAVMCSPVSNRVGNIVTQSLTVNLLTIQD
jgi:hypothetical protein